MAWGHRGAHRGKLTNPLLLLAAGGTASPWTAGGARAQPPYANQFLSLGLFFSSFQLTCKESEAANS